MSLMPSKLSKVSSCMTWEKVLLAQRYELQLSGYFKEVGGQTLALGSDPIPRPSKIALSS